MRTAILIVLSATVTATAAFFVGGSPPPQPTNVILGEACWRCRRPILNADLAAEQVAPNGLGSKFRSVHCLATWIGQQPGPVEGHYWVTNSQDRKWIQAEGAYYVRMVVNDRTMERDFLAFGDSAAAAAAARDNGSKVEQWADVLERGKADPLGGD